MENSEVGLCLTIILEEETIQVIVTCNSWSLDYPYSQNNTELKRKSIGHRKETIKPAWDSKKLA